MRNLVQLWLAGSLACFSITSQPSWGAESQQFGGKSQAAAQQNLNLPPQSLARSLIQLGKSRNISIIFPTRLVAGLEAPAVQGKLDTLEALEQLLANSPIHYRLLNPRVVRLEARPHIAETAAEPPLSYDFIEEVSVIGRQITGSRLKRHELEGSAPVDVISAPRIAELGAQSVGELLKFMPAVSGNSTSTSIGNGGNGTATVTLRGLPASNTLVLINGRRVANNGFAGKAVDLNSIAPETIEQIEILKSGSSAVYGSDAIAGVVNINLKKDYDGMAFNQYFGQSSRGDLQTHSSNLSLGRDFERGNIMLNASHYRQQPIF
ncbi:MAG: TonB-dependent receptor, partial [Cellvibrionaceae bacterium]|nr:TonB-dependent receptor [Cellvibrionaceae bacterium]